MIVLRRTLPYSESQSQRGQPDEGEHVLLHQIGGVRRGLVLLHLGLRALHVGRRLGRRDLCKVVDPLSLMLSLIVWKNTLQGVKSSLYGH